jgi:hypothetical protein
MFAIFIVAIVIGIRINPNTAIGNLPSRSFEVADRAVVFRLTVVIIPDTFDIRPSLPVVRTTTQGYMLNPAECIGASDVGVNELFHFGYAVFDKGRAYRSRRFVGVVRNDQR